MLHSMWCTDYIIIIIAVADVDGCDLVLTPPINRTTETVLETAELGFLAPQEWGA